MPSLMTITSGDGDPVVVEVDEQLDGVVQSTRPGEILTVADSTVEAALQRLRPLADVIISTLRDP